MQKFLTLLGLLLVSGVSTAQITLTASDFQSSSGTEFYSVTNSNVDFSSTGANYNWDFSNLNEINQDTLTYNSVSQASFLVQAVFGLFGSSDYQANYFTENQAFALANIPPTLMPITIDQVDEYIKVDNNAITKVGYSVSIQGQGIPFASDTIERLYKLPLTYGDIDSSRAYTSFDLNPIYDAQLKQYVQHYSEVDGYGSITTPYGTFNCLRVHHIIEELDSVYVSISGGAGTWYELPLPTKHVYEWWTNNEDIPLLRIETNESFGIQTITSTQYKDNISVGIQSFETAVNLEISPNPSSTEVNFSQQIDHLNMYTATGALVLSKENVSMINVSSFPKGVYLLEITLKGKKKQERLVIQ